jgi:16S rRNA C1402 N4-methylase RsmH
MRYDRTQELTASDLVNRLSVSDLEDLFFKYADERWARRIATTIAAYRRHHTIAATSELVSLIEAAIPASVRRQHRVHPATQCFAALRSAVNDEFWALDQGAWSLSAVLADAARLVILTYNSIEDRTVKRTFRSLAGRPDPVIAPRRKIKPGALSGPRALATALPTLAFSLTLPYEGAVAGKGAAAPSVSPFLHGFGRDWSMRPVTSKPLVPAPEEIARNPLARSCKLRALEKTVLPPPDHPR